MGRFNYYKGHATGNDFVIALDPHGMVDLSPEQVADLCHRHTGVGADGVLRVVRAQQMEEWAGDPELWFMDYRNADGSVAEMCGNGLRLFGRFLMNENLVAPGNFQVATRAGIKQVEPGRNQEIAVGLGRVELGQDSVRVRLGKQVFDAVAVDVGNPHAVCFVDDPSTLDLHQHLSWEPAEVFPDGVNVEFVSVVGPDELRLRVIERGSGETLSCGTGVAAAATAHRTRQGGQEAVTVHVPGGTLVVEFRDGEVWLSGPAVVTGKGEYWGQPGSPWA